MMKIKQSMSINKVHYYSGIILTLFVGLHLFNHVYSLFGISAHIELMNKFRIVYRNVLVESILLLSVLVQIVSGIKLFRKKKKQHLSFFGKLQIYSGLYLAFFLLIHVSAVLGARYVLGLDTNFYFGVAGLNTFPFNLFFVPYYGLAIFSFFAHIASIHAHKMKNSILGISPHQQSYGILIFGILITLVIFYGLTNQFNGVNIPNEFNILIGK